MDKMSFYTQVYKHKPNDIISKDDETLWRRQTPKLLYPLGQYSDLNTDATRDLVKFGHIFVSRIT